MFNRVLNTALIFNHLKWFNTLWEERYSLKLLVSSWQIYEGSVVLLATEPDCLKVYNPGQNIMIDLPQVKQILISRNYNSLPTMMTPCNLPHELANGLS